MMKKPVSIIQERCLLEIGIGKRSVYRHKQSMLKRLVLNPRRGYRKIKSFSEKTGRVTYEPGTGLIFDSFPQNKKMMCHYAFDWRENSKAVYSVPLDQCYDIEAWQESTHRVYIKKGHRASMFILRKAGNLLRRDLRTGVILDEIYLPPKYRFVEIIEDREVGHLYLKSKIYSKQGEDVISAIVIFSFPHLEFSAFLEVKKSVFGKSAIKTEICQGALLILHSNNTIKLYSLEEILSKFLVHPFKLGEKFSEDNVTCCVGKRPLGLPLNVLISSAPPVLFEIKSAGHSLQIGGHPWHYIICPTAKKYQVFSLKKKLAVEGMLEESNEVEPDVIVFHPDESLKIVHATSSKLLPLNLFRPLQVTSESRIRFCAAAGADYALMNDLKRLKLVEQIYKITPEPYPRLETFFSLNAFELQKRDDVLRPKRSSFGRKLSQNNYFNDVMSLMLFDYEDELDIFAVLRVKQPVLFEGPQLEIIYTDSPSGKILQARNLPDCSWPMVYDCQYSFEIDGPLLIVTTKKYENMKRTMYVFLLTDENNTQYIEGETIVNVDN